MQKENRPEQSVPFRKKIAHRRAVRISIYLLGLITTVAAMADFLCNEKPLYVKYRNANLFPALSWKGYADVDNGDSTGTQRIVYAVVNWHELKKEKVIWCPVVFSPGKSDWTYASYQSPFDHQVNIENGNEEAGNYRGRHWLGTTKTGADVLSGIIHGARVSISIGICSMLIAGLTGILLGAFAGFFGDHKIVVSKSGFIICLLLGIPLAYFYGICLPGSQYASLENTTSISIIFRVAVTLSISTVCIYSTYLLGKFAGRLIKINHQTFLPVDQFISRAIEIFNSIPRIVLIITLSAIARPSILNLILIIGFTSWTDIARLVRAEMLKVRASEFMQSAEVSGIKTVRRIFLHALPNVVIPAITAITLGIAAAILTESALSFLGIGVPADVVTWGSLLNEGRQNFSAWWLILFPGLAIFITVTAFNIAGDALSEAIDSTNR